MVGTGQEDKCEELLPIIYDPILYAQRQYTGKDGDLIAESSVNFYGDGITKDEVNNFYNKMANPKDSKPLAYGLNSRLVKNNGVLVEEVYKSGGKYGKTIDVIIGHLQNAIPFADNEAQTEYIAKLIEYYKTGDLKTWDEYNILWVQENEGQVDFVNGFIEDYNDPLGRKATWESVVNFKDIEASHRTQVISENAQWFEDNSPVDKKFKKDEVKGVSAKVITIACLGGDCYPATPIGINLPNSNWIRKDYGSKSVTIANVTDAYDKASLEMPKSALSEFAYDQAEIDLVKKCVSLT